MIFLFYNRIVNSLVNGNEIRRNELLQLLADSIPQSTDVKNIVYDYDSKIRTTCKPAITLLWDPDGLITCETEYRWRTFSNSPNIDAYEKFDKEISQPFQQKALNLMISVNVRIHFLLL